MTVRILFRLLNRIGTGRCIGRPIEPAHRIGVQCDAVGSAIVCPRISLAYRIPAPETRRPRGMLRLASASGRVRPLGRAALMVETVGIYCVMPRLGI